jgi:rhodanese-related sulfurtransferase
MKSIAIEKKFFLLTLIIFFIFFINIKPLYAMLPPEFFSSGIQVMLQLFGILAASFLSVIIIIKRYFKKVVTRKIWIIISIFSIIIIVGAVIYVNFTALEKNKKFKTNLQKEMSSVISETKFKSSIDLDASNNSNLLNKILLKGKYTKLLNSKNQQEFVNYTNKLKGSVGISSSELVNMLNSKSVLVIDIRHKIAFKYGRISGSINISLADFLHGGWKTLSLEKYKYVIFYCFSGGTSGVLVSEFRNETGMKNIYFIKEGLVSVIKNPNVNFIGEISLGNLFGNVENQRLFKNDVDKILKDGGIPIDCRTSKKFNKNHFPGAIHFFYYIMPTIEMNKLLSSLNPNKKYFFIYDSYVSFYSAFFTRRLFQEFNLKYIGFYNTSSKKIE